MPPSFCRRERGGNIHLESDLWPDRVWVSGLGAVHCGPARPAQDADRLQPGIPAAPLELQTMHVGGSEPVQQTCGITIVISQTTFWQEMQNLSQPARLSKIQALCLLREAVFLEEISRKRLNTSKCT